LHEKKTPPILKSLKNMDLIYLKSIVVARGKKRREC